MRVILASGSPRRKELLKQLVADFEVLPAKGSEIYTEQEPAKIVQQLAAQKAAEVESSVVRQEEETMLVIGADTVVAFQGQILGKPADAKQAKEMLKTLASDVHQVYTGVALIINKNGRKSQRIFYEKTDVTFYPISREDIYSYAESGDPLDKAGSYGIQGSFAIHVKGITGDYNNVVGLPLGRLYQELIKL